MRDIDQDAISEAFNDGVKQGHDDCALRMEKLEQRISELEAECEKVAREAYQAGNEYAFPGWTEEMGRKPQMFEEFWSDYRKREK